MGYPFARTPYVDERRELEELWWYFCRNVVRQTQLALEPFARSLQDWINELLSRRLPRDWREQLDAFLDWWDVEGIEVAAEQRGQLADWIEVWARLRGRMPLPLHVTHVGPVDAAADDSETAAAAIIDSELFRVDAGRLGELAETDHTAPWRPPPPPKVKSIEQRKGLGGWYDEAVASGQYEPGFFVRVAVALARVLFLDSTPSRVVHDEDGNTQITLSGGPTSGALAGQAGTIWGLTRAAAAGRALTEIGETVADTTFQEATGSPLGPSNVVPRRKGPKQRQKPQKKRQHKPKRANKSRKLSPEEARLRRGTAFNRARTNAYPYNEIPISKPGRGKPWMLDAYDPVKGEIVFRRETQFSEVQLTTAKAYLREFVRKYSPGSVIADVPSAQGLAGRKLEGKMIFEVPPQWKAVPTKVLEEATRRKILLRDSNGKVYNSH